MVEIESGIVHAWCFDILMERVYHIVGSRYMVAINTAIIKGPVISRTNRITPICGRLGFAFVKGFEDILISF